ncbi:S1/P1 nuclease [Mucilaginibacter mali]|uniref:S1/P1 nuclease n=1 Tax=Mucilaginibacter mali TaxID=2740462 RepID=A0A7D4QFW8_9SPHI|nr:S1/P1 nuclease [Mucilaginibacter mali]QKJ32804.1 S1/P1 nuclease [Mucilaginibacter mali]
MKRIFLTTITVIAVLVLVSWGVVGHRTVATIATNHLTPAAQAGIRKLIGDTSLADISTWADEVRSADPAFASTGPWHYINLPAGYNYDQFITAVNNAKAPNVYTALQKCIGDLKSDTTSLRYRRMALKFVVHLVGDLHQPMHVSHAEDQGGNLVQVTFNGDPTNLHSLWDSRLIARHPLPVSTMVTEYDKATPQEIAKWQADDMMKWLYESYLVSEQIYAAAAKNPKFTDDYYNIAMPVVQKRLLQAGIRLAGVLNSIYK